jgi:hypothetical protein
MLTKSDIASCRQCPRKLWLEHHLPGAASLGDSTSWRRARDGIIVGENARERLCSDRPDRYGRDAAQPCSAAYGPHIPVRAFADIRLTLP